ncbi:MAG: hypothetical protein QM535_12615 [Limnohabitans sp.]|nr:hypothetical protein [Limnohabitans sp.]
MNISLPKNNSPEINIKILKEFCQLSFLSTKIKAAYHTIERKFESLTNFAIRCWGIPLYL